MASCTTYGKMEFLNALASMLDDDDVIMISSYLGSLDLRGKGKNKTKDIIVKFPANDFAKKEGVYDLTKMSIHGIVIGKQDNFTKETMETVDYHKDYWKDKQVIISK